MLNFIKLFIVNSYILRSHSKNFATHCPIIEWGKSINLRFNQRFILVFHHGRNSHPHEKRNTRPRRKLRARELASLTTDWQTCFQTVVEAGEGIATSYMYAWTRLPSSKWKNCGEEIIVWIMDGNTCKIIVQPRWPKLVLIAREINPRD